MRLYPIYIALLLIFIVLQLIYGKGSFADVNLEEYDMSKVEAGDFLKLLKEKSSRLNIPMDMHSRFVNAGFSGGEKKKNEVLQLDLLNPNLVIMDETDSGLDVDALKSTSEAVNQLRSSNRSFIIITHYLRLLEYIEPDFVHVFQDGSIVESGDKSLANRIDKKGYA